MYVIQYKTEYTFNISTNFNCLVTSQQWIEISFSETIFSDISHDVDNARMEKWNLQLWLWMLYLALVLRPNLETGI